MARQFRLPGFREWVGEIKQVTAREAATRIVGELIFLGPWYSGQFAKNWVVKVGDVRIPASVDAYSGFKGRTARTEVPIPVIPSLRGTGAGKDVGYTIGNRTKYRNVALDLEPGRVERARFLSAPKDWYRTYVEGGSLRDTLRDAAFAASQNPRIKGFKKNSFIGPAGSVIN